MKRLWRIYRGTLMNEEALAATINKQLWSMHYGIEAKMPGSQETDVLLRAQKAISVGRLKYDIIHRGNVIGHVSDDCNKHLVGFLSAFHTLKHVCVIYEHGISFACQVL